MAWPPRPPDAALEPSQGAHLDSSEDTGFSTELLRSQGFRPASVKSPHGREPQGGEDSQAPPNSPDRSPPASLQEAMLRPASLSPLGPRRLLQGCG